MERTRRLSTQVELQQLQSTTPSRSSLDHSYTFDGTFAGSARDNDNYRAQGPDLHQHTMPNPDNSHHSVAENPFTPATKRNACSTQYLGSGPPRISCISDADYIDPSMSTSHHEDSRFQALGLAPFTSATASVDNDHDDIFLLDQLYHPVVDENASLGHSETSSLATAAVKATGNRHPVDDHDHGLSPQAVFERKAKSAYPDVTREYWTSIWLQKRTLIVLAALFVSLGIALVILWFTNKAQNGFSTTLSTNHYAWTYGPTAVLVVVVSLWRQVDYNCKMIQPWLELRKGPTEAERSMLLDYLSPIIITSFVRALRYRHYLVAASIAGFVILKSVILASTGLLVLTPVSVTESRTVMLTTAFDGESFWKTMPGEPHKWGSPQEALYPNVSGRPIHSYLNMFKAGAIYTDGISDNVVFQSIEPLESGLQSISAEVVSFVPEISCDIARATHGEPFLKLESATCSFIPYHRPTLCYQNCPANFSYGLWRVNCSHEPGDDEGYYLSTMDVDTPYDMRFAILVTDLGIYDDAIPEMIPQHTAAVICDVDYSMHKSIVTQNLTSGQSTVIETSRMQNLEDLTGLMLGEIIYSALMDAKYLDGQLRPDPRANVMSSVTPDLPLFNILLQTLDGQQSIDRFLSEETLRSSTKQTWTSIAAHFMRENYLKPDNSKVPGTIVFIENRLLVSAVSLWIMVVGLFLASLLTVCIVLVNHQGIVPRDTGIMSTDAVILASSHSLHELLRNCNNMRTSEITNLLHGKNFDTGSDESFQITVTNDESLDTRERPKAKLNVWIPFAAQYPMIITTLTVPLACIVALEVLYRISKTNHGLVDVSRSEDTATYLSRYISAFLALLIATCFNALDFTTASFAVYSSLRAGSVSASRCSRLHLLGSLPPVALFRSVRAGHAGSFFTGLAGIIGSVLTVVASGLWVVDRAVIIEQSVVASLASGWDIKWTNSSASGDGGAGVVLDQVQHGSDIIPATIWNDIVLPDIADIKPLLAARPGHADGQPTTQNFTFEISGLRPLLSCEVVAKEHIVIDGDVNALPPLPSGCQRGGPTGDNDYYNISSMPWSEDSYYGGFYDLHLGPWNDDFNFIDYDSGESDLHSALIQDNPAGCPSIGVVLASPFADGNRPDDASVIMCSQKIQEVLVEVTYTGADMKTPIISTSPAPVLIDTLPRNLTNGTDGVDTFPYRVQIYLDYNLTLFAYNTSLVSPFLDQMVYGPDGIAPDDLLGEANQDTFIKAVNDLYTKYMCLVIDARFRRPIPHEARASEAGEQGFFSGTAYGFSSKLQLNRASKTTMQVMLGVMFVLGVLTLLATDLRGCLPRKPTSIASRMALLAGSDLCDEHKGLLPHDAVWMSEQKLAEVFDGWLFSLGWWRESDSRAHEHTGETATSSETAIVSEERQRLRRFGIDVGAPEQLGFRESKWWTLRRRLARRDT